MDKTLPLNKCNDGGVATLITDGWNADQLRWYLHHCLMERGTNVDVSIITAIWYTYPVLMYPLSLPDGRAVQC